MFNNNSMLGFVSRLHHVTGFITRMRTRHGPPLPYYLEIGIQTMPSLPKSADSMTVVLLAMKIDVVPFRQ